MPGVSFLSFGNLVLSCAVQGFQKWGFGAKVAILTGSVAPEFLGDSPPKKWRFWRFCSKVEKSGDFWPKNGDF